MDEYKTYQVPTKEPIWQKILTIVAMLLVADIASFVWWIASGQTPVGEFYLGKLTASIISLFM